MKKIILGIFALAMLASCEVDDLKKLDLLNLPTGGYMRTISPAAAALVYSKANLGGATLTFVVEAVDPDGGTQSASYDIAAEFRDRTAANGNNTKALKTLKSIPTTGFTKDATSGYLRGSFTVSAAEVMASLGVTADQVTKGDSFELSTTLVMKDGRKYNAVNTDPDILGGAFYNSPFFHRINVVD